MSDTSARRKQRRAVSEQHVDSLARYTLRSDNCTARPSDDVGQRLMARVAATPRPVRPVVPPPPRWLLWWQHFMAASPGMSARLTSVSAAALLMLMMFHSSLTALNPNGTPTLSFSNVRAAYDGLDVVARQGDDPAVEASAADLAYELQQTRPRPAYTPVPQDLPMKRVYPASDPPVTNISLAVNEPEDTSTIAPPRSLSPTQPAIWAAVPDTSRNPYTGATFR